MPKSTHVLRRHLPLSPSLSSSLPPNIPPISLHPSPLASLPPFPLCSSPIFDTQCRLSRAGASSWSSGPHSLHHSSTSEVVVVVGCKFKQTSKGVTAVTEVPNQDFDIADSLTDKDLHCNCRPDSMEARTTERNRHEEPNAGRPDLYNE